MKYSLFLYIPTEYILALRLSGIELNENLTENKSVENDTVLGMSVNNKDKLDEFLNVVVHSTHTSPVQNSYQSVEIIFQDD